MGLTEEERRALHRRYWTASAAWSEAWEEQGYIGEPPPRPAFPEEIRGLTCGAKTRQGHPCKRTDLFVSGRCKFHGGMSTGPKRRKEANANGQE